MYTEAELGKLFLFSSTGKGGKIRVDAEHARHLKELGKSPWVASVRTAPGWLSNLHINFVGLASGIVHIDGEKLWLFWPLTPNNLRWWRIQHPHSWTGHGSRITEALHAREGLEVLHAIDPVAFVVPPFHIHAVIAFQNSIHSCVVFAHAMHWDFARRGLEFCKRPVHNPDHAASRSIALVEQVVNETPIWRHVSRRVAAGHCSDLQ
jgi:hypothetical protein